MVVTLSNRAMSRSGSVHISSPHPPQALASSLPALLLLGSLYLASLHMSEESFPKAPADFLIHLIGQKKMPHTQPQPIRGKGRGYYGGIRDAPDWGDRNASPEPDQGLCEGERRGFGAHNQHAVSATLENVKLLQFLTDLG